MTTPAQKSRREPRLIARDVPGNPEYRIVERRTSLGSDASNTVVLRGSGVAPRHAVIRRRFGHYLVENLEAGGGGTWVNGQRVYATAGLGDRDELRLGSSRLLCVGFPPPPRAGLWASVGNEILLGVSALVIGLIVYFYGAQLIRHLISPGQVRVDVSSPAWLEKVNHYRAIAHLGPARADSALSAGDLDHVTYLLANSKQAILMNRSLGLGLYFENPTRVAYSGAGARAGPESDVVAYPDNLSSGLAPPLFALDRFMASPFARMAILDPELRTVGYAEDCVNGACAGALNIVAGRQGLSPDGEIPLNPIEYPPDGSMVSAGTLADAIPDPLQSCPGYSPPAGLPITLQTGRWRTPRLTAYTLVRESPTGAAIHQQACGFDASNFANPDSAHRWLGRALLKAYGAVVIIPRYPLAPRSRYTVSAIVDGNPYRWSFMTGSEVRPTARRGRTDSDPGHGRSRLRP